MAAEARRCIAALDERRQDITMLWLLKNTRWLEEFRFGMDLLDWVRNIMKVSFTVCGGKEFQQEVSREFSERGIRPVAPERCVESWKKDIAKEKCINAKWPKPYSPVMLQTRPGEGHQGSGAFVMFSSWQDAMIALQKIAVTKSYTGADGKRYPAEMVYENQIADMYGYDYPCRIILDCDAKLKEFDGKYSIEELCQSIDKVPEFFARRLIEIGAIEKTDVVVVYEKEKSREGKASRHYITNIKGRSTWETQQVLGEIFGAELEKMREAADKAVNAGGSDGKKRKKSEEVPAIPEPWQVTDTVPHHGRGQYSVLGFFDKKKGETEYPCITRKWRIVGGKAVSRKTCNVTRAESTLKHKMALQMLHKTCYTCPVDDFITIHKKFMTQKQVYLFFFWRDQPAARLELTRTPNGGRQKKGGAEAPALDQALPVLEAPDPPAAQARRSCRSGPSQRFPGSRGETGGTISTRPCPV